MALASGRRPAASWRRSGNWGRDAELATRRLVRAPALVAAVAGTLTVGLGMFAIVYTVVDKILIEPMPYRDPDDLYFVWRDYRTIFDLNRGWLGGTDVAELKKAGGVIEDAVGLGRGLMTFSPREGADPTEIAVMVASPNLFEVLGVPPALGRGFAPNEVGPNRPPVVVLTHALWNRLGANPSIVGTEVRLNGQSHTVIGVMPPRFAFVRNASLGVPQRADAFVTFSIHLAETNPDAGAYAGLVRVRRGTSPRELASAVDAVGRTVDARDFKSRGLKLYPVGLKPDLVSRVRPALLVLGFAGVFLVLVLMVNLGSVLLARVAQREHGTRSRVRSARTAWPSPARRSSKAASSVCIGGVAATIAAVWGTRALVALRRSICRGATRLPSTGASPPSSSGLASCSVCWPPPFLLRGRRASRSRPCSRAAPCAAAEATAGCGGAWSSRRSPSRSCCSVPGGLVVRSFERLLQADPGFKPEGVLALRVPIPGQLVPEAADAIALQDRIERALAAIPGVNRVSATGSLPLTASAGQQTIGIPGAPGNTGNAERDRPLVDIIGARAGYVEAIGMRLLDGRTFDKVRHDGVREAVIDRLFQKHFFPSGSPLGAKIPFRDQSLTIVGVVDQARLYDVHQDGRPQLFVRAEDWGYRSLTFVLQTAREPQGVVPDVRASIRRIDPRLAVADVRTMGEVVDAALRQQRLSAVLIAGFALGALLLAAMGLFGVVAGSVTRRRHELAVRLAVGADHGRVLRLVLREGAALVGTRDADRRCRRLLRWRPDSRRAGRCVAIRSADPGRRGVRPRPGCDGRVLPARASRA